MINKPLVKTKEKSSIALRPQEIKKFFVIASTLSDLAEDILEREGDYNKEFLQGLNRSIRESRRGEVSEVKSLAELS